MKTILTLDLGTTYFKTGLVDEEGRLLALHRVPTPVERPRPDRWEMSAAAFREAIRQGIADLRASGEPFRDVAAVTFATQTNSFLLLDARDEPLTPLVLWPDLRAASYADAMERWSGDPAFRRTTGVPQIGVEFSPAKLLWWREQHDRAWRRLHRFCLISDYLTLWMTGEHASEAGAAGLTGLIDVHDLSWRSSALSELGLPASSVPRLVRAGTDLGPIRPAVATELGLSADCRFVAGSLDQYAGAIGAGNVRPGRLSETTGTVLCSVCCADAFVDSPAPIVFQGPSFRREQWFRFAFGSTSANLLEWYRDQLPGRPSFESLSEAATTVPPGSGGVRVRPDFSLLDKASVFTGVRPDHGEGHHVRAIMEAVALALRHQVQALGAGGPDPIRACGGAARSPTWLQIKADVLNKPVAATVCPEPTSLGAAVLAAYGLGWADVTDLADAWVELEQPHEPDPVAVRYYTSFPERP
jgi:xylulokinase